MLYSEYYARIKRDTGIDIGRHFDDERLQKEVPYNSDVALAGVNFSTDDIVNDTPAGRRAVRVYLLSKL